MNDSEKLKAAPLALFRGIIALASLVLLAPASVCASSTAAGPVATRPTEQEIYEACGQGCLYQRANENIALQAIYISNHVQTLRDLDSTEKAQALGSYCLPNEDGDDCFERYRRMNIVALYKLRDAMIKNSDSAAQLMNKKVTVGTKGTKGNPAAAEVQISGRKAAKPQVPYVVTYEDIKKEIPKLKVLTSQDYRDWASRLRAAPDLTDFVKFKRIYRDPDHPERGTMMVVERDASGRIAYDDKAYKKAMKYHAEHLQDMQRDLKAIQGNVPSTRARTVDPESETDFKASRKIIVEAANGGLVKGRIPSQSRVDMPGRKNTESEIAKVKTERRRQTREEIRKEKEPQVVRPERSEDGAEQFLTVTLKPEQVLDIIENLKKD